MEKRTMKKKPPPVEISSRELEKLLVGLRIRLDCGHRCTVGHNFSNTLFIYSEGRGRLRRCVMNVTTDYMY
jgi:hypothetical protein